MSLVKWVINYAFRYPHYALLELLSRLNYQKENVMRKIEGPSKDEKVRINSLYKAIDKSIKWFDIIQRKDGSIGTKRWKIWDTANTVLAMIKAEHRSRTIDDAINFILDGQREDGGFFFNKSMKGHYYCTEVVSVALSAIYCYEKRVTAEIQKGIEFLLKKQQVCGGWELPYMGPEADEVNLNLNYHPSVTGFALQPLLLTNSISEAALKKAIHFLEKTQYPNGSWGRSRPYYLTEGYAINSISKALSLIDVNINEVKEKIKNISKKCTLYVRKNQNSDGSWSTRGPSSNR